MGQPMGQPMVSDNISRFVHFSSWMLCDQVCRQLRGHWYSEAIDKASNMLSGQLDNMLRRRLDNLLYRQLFEDLGVDYLTVDYLTVDR